MVHGMFQLIAFVFWAQIAVLVLWGFIAIPIKAAELFGLAISRIFERKPVPAAPRDPRLNQYGQRVDCQSRCPAPLPVIPLEEQSRARRERQIDALEREFAARRMARQGRPVTAA